MSTYTDRVSEKLVKRGICIFPGEIEAIEKVVEYGRIYGFGSMMAHLSTVWAQSLMDEYGFDKKAAMQAAHNLAFATLLVAPAGANSKPESNNG